MDKPDAKDYTEYMLSKEWRKISDCKLRDENKCVRCRRQSTEVHHKSYKNWRNENEHMDDLVTFCRECHGACHGSGGFIDNPAGFEQFLNSYVPKTKRRIHKIIHRGTSWGTPWTNHENDGVPNACCMESEGAATKGTHAVTVDIVILIIKDSKLHVLMTECDEEPFKGYLSLPGRFVYENESLDIAARKKLFEETGIDGLFLEQFFAFGTVDRDPRGRVISVAYYALVSSDKNIIIKKGTKWVRTDGTTGDILAFDHRKIVDRAILRLRERLEYTTIGFRLLPPQFMLRQLQDVYEAILEVTLEGRNFRKKIRQMGVIKKTGKKQEGVRYRPAMFFTLNN